MVFAPLSFLTKILRTGRPVFLLLLAAAWLSPTAVQAEEPQGQQIFLAQKCQLCHAVPAVGIEAKTRSEKLAGPDLGTAETLRPAKEMIAYLRQTGEIDGTRHKREFKGSDEELQALVDWLLELSKAAEEEGGGAGASMP